MVVCVCITLGGLDLQMPKKHVMPNIFLEHMCMVWLYLCMQLESSGDFFEV